MQRKLVDAKAFVDAIQENMSCLIYKTISSGDCVVYFRAANNLKHVFKNGYLKALPVQILGQKWRLMVASNFLMLFN